MKIFPAIDLYSKCAVRLYKGDYSQMTVYSENPVEIAFDFRNKGAEFIHLVDLEGAKDGTTPNIDVVEKIVKETGLRAEIGGGIRSRETLKKYIDAGVSRVILGTAQSFNRLSKPIREQATEVRKCRTFFKAVTFVLRQQPELDSTGEVVRWRNLGMYYFVHTDEIRNSYDTYRVIESLAKSGFQPRTAPMGGEGQQPSVVVHVPRKHAR